MNLFADIKFNNDIIVNQECSITYSGFLFKNNSESVTIVFGFDDEWNNTTEQEMIKTENGFTANIKILDFHNFNFCFRNSNYEWDNNNNKNYSAPISKLEENFIINENIIENILDNLLNTNVPEPIKAQTFTDTSFEVLPENTVPTNIEDSIGEIIEETELDKDLDVLFSDIYEDNRSDEYINKSKNINEQKFSMDSLIDEILTPIIEANNLDSNINIEETNTPEEPTYSDNLTTYIEELDDNSEKVDEIIDNLVSELYEVIDTNKNSQDEQEEANFGIKDDFSEKIIQDLNSNSENISSLKTDELNISSDIPSSSNEISFTNLFEEETESSLLEDISNDSKEDLFNNEEKQDDSFTTALTPVDNIDNYIVSPRSLGKFYMLKKKIKLAFYKLSKLPKIILSNFIEYPND